MTSNIKERRTRVLLSLYLLGREQAHNIFSEKLQQIFALPSESPRSRGTIRQMLSEGVITKESEGTYQITKEGITELALTFPYVRFLTEQWDGLFRIVSYEIPEKKRKLRDSLRRSVYGWGLGPWHRSFWITPHPVLEELKKLTIHTDWEQYIQAFEGKHLLGSSKVLLNKVWELSSLEQNYKETFKKWHAVLSDQTLNKDQKFTRIVNDYIEVLKNDPGLPPELLNKSWIGYEAWNLFNEMKKILL